LAIHLPFARLSHWQQVAFATAIIERMLPNYQMFSENSEFGHYDLLRNQLDLVWQWLDKNNKIKININAQLNKLEEQTPDPEEFDSFGVFPALDVCMAMMSLWQLIQTNGTDKDDEDINSISRLSQNSVNYYVELLTQSELFDFLKIAAETKRSCQLAKEMVLSEGLSNLGIAIE